MSANGNPDGNGAWRPSARTGPVPRGLVVLLGASAAVITAAGIHAIAWLAGPVFLALTIVISISPLRGWLVRRGLPGWAATTALLLAVYAVLLSLFVVALVSVAQLATVLPQYADRLGELVDDLGDVLARFGVGADEIRAIGGSMDLGRLITVIRSVLSGIGGITSNVVFLLSLLLFFAVEAGAVGTRLAAIGADRPAIAVALVDFARGTRNYMVVTTLFGLLVAVLDGVALLFLGIPLPVLWALLAFITNYVPNIGFIIGVLPPALLALLGGGWQQMLLVVAIYSVINFVIQSLIQTRVVGSTVGLSTMVAFLSLLFWTWLIGPLGAVLAIPLTLLTKALLVDVDPRARWAGALIGVHGRLPQGKDATGPRTGTRQAADPATTKDSDSDSDS